MKNEKLELLLNKVVEFNQPDVAYYKGFLYKDSRGYYIKVVEGILGHFEINDKVRLKDGDGCLCIPTKNSNNVTVTITSNTKFCDEIAEYIKNRVNVNMKSCIRYKDVGIFV